MINETRITALKEKHRALDEAIHQEEIKPHPDESVLGSLKKQKLHLKDEIKSSEYI